MQLPLVPGDARSVLTWLLSSELDAISEADAICQYGEQAVACTLRSMSELLNLTEEGSLESSELQEISSIASRYWNSAPTLFDLERVGVERNCFALER